MNYSNMTIFIRSAAKFDFGLNKYSLFHNPLVGILLIDGCISVLPSP
jgi:hypothetical protein